MQTESSSAVQPDCGCAPALCTGTKLILCRFPRAAPGSQDQPLQQPGLPAAGLQQGLPAQSRALALPGHLCLTLLCTFTSLFGAVTPPANGRQDQQCATLMSLGCCLPGGSAGQQRPLLSKGKKRDLWWSEEKTSVQGSAGAVGMSWQNYNPIWLRSQLARVGVGKWLPFSRTFLITTTQPH